MTAPLHTVHVRVNDAANEQPTPVRLRVTDADGNYYPPHGRLASFAIDPGQDVGGNVLVEGLPHAYIDGGCEIDLPPGQLTIEVAKGPEYVPVRLETKLGIGQLALRFTIDRWTDLRREGWYSGDTHVEAISPHAALLEARAEDVAVVNILARLILAQSARRSDEAINPAEAALRTCPSISNILAFSGQQPALHDAGHLIVVNTLNEALGLGAVGLLNCHRTVFPLTFGGGLPWGRWALADLCQQCHRKGGLTVWIPAEHYESGEPLADLILGQIDALELSLDSEQGPKTEHYLNTWYALLNCGFRLPLAGGSSKNSNGRLMGATRTYVWLGNEQALSYQNWIEGLRSGRDFVTAGPILKLEVNGSGPGASLDLESSPPGLHLRVHALGCQPSDRVEVVINGRPTFQSTATGSPSQCLIEEELQMDSGGWIAAICRRDLGGRSAVVAITSPVYVRIKDQPAPVCAEAVESLDGQLKACLDWLLREPSFEDERGRQHRIDIFTAARAELARRVAG